MQIKKLKEIPYGNAFVEKANENTFYLWSYRTLVAKVEKGWLTINGLYSMTTRRHIGAFMREYCGSTYQVAKQIYEDGYMLNIDTGEVVEIDN
jgi:hypothetical protein